ncbi:hypothetical protein PAL_GLEAN10015860 [Pteropus alecto]|uniref:Uncharacterized protein n=1 Tax=Pteropus alecto TaxID=9402 RepID=L5L0P4_PTEAL|nr:hypothetical protein PAL_GLEAN10015860 [Pteropus alecto]
MAHVFRALWAQPFREVPPRILRGGWVCGDLGARAEHGDAVPDRFPSYSTSIYSNKFGSCVTTGSIATVAPECLAKPFWM